MNSSPIIVVKEQNTEMSKTVIVPIHDEPSAASEKTNLTQFTFEWKNLCYQVDLPGKDKKTKPLLEYMNGSVKSGEVLAVMGGSGAGKSTLLGVLSGRVAGGHIQGDITLEGKLRNPKTWLKDYAFVEQDDLLHTHLTVEETLNFAARFRLPPKTPEYLIKQRVDEVIMDLGLNGCRKTIIGGDGVKGISGGERKRVSIAIELMTLPKLLILDEPTSGLDSFIAFNVMKMIKEIAVKRNLVVIQTLHQPRTDILDLLDKICLLSAGKTLYFGSIASGLEFFEECGLKLPPKVNPSDHFIDQISRDQRSAEQLEESEKRIEFIYNAWNKKNKIESAPKSELTATGSTNSLTSDCYAGSGKNIGSEFLTLFKRNWMIVTRDLPALYAAIGSSLFVSVLMGALFWQSGDDSKGIQNQVGLLYFSAINLTFSTIIPMLAAFDFEKRIARKERASNSYRHWTAFITIWLAHLPYKLLACLLFATPAYWMTGLDASAAKFFTFLTIIIIHTTCASIMGAAIAATAPNVTVAQILAPVIVTVQLLYGGPLVSLDLIPIFLRWARYISIISNTTGALLQNQFLGKVYTCPPGAVLCFPTGQVVLEQFSQASPYLWWDVGINVLILLALLVLGIVGFEKKTRPFLKLK